MSVSSVSQVDVTILSYDELERGSAATAETLTKALKEQGIVGIRGIPRYRQLVQQFIEGARIFSALNEETKSRYAPNRDAGEFTGYELGAEKFTRADGTQVTDDSKASYYGFVPDNSLNRWPEDGELKGRFQEIGTLMVEVGSKIMKNIGLSQVIPLGQHHVGRMLHYRKGCQADKWCGAHFDHGLFTALLPAVYFNEQSAQVPEPKEAGLFVMAEGDASFKKVVSDDPEVMLFQSAEFGQLAKNDAIIATKHEVRKSLDDKIERFTMALFFNPPFDFTVHSTSRLVDDARFGGGNECSYKAWHIASLDRYRAK